MKAAVISLGSKSSKMLIKAMKKYLDAVDDINLKEIEVNLGEKGMEVLYKGKDIKDYECIYVKGSFKYVTILRTLTLALSKKAYMPIKAGAFTTGHDKLLTYLKLQHNNIPMPTTYLSSSPVAAKELLERVNYPIIMKFPSGTQGKGVMFADSFASASSMLDALEALKQPFIIQEYVETGGTDVRLIVVGDKVVAAMKRKAIIGEKRSNIHAGGVGEPYEPSPKMKKIAVKTAEALGAEICGVDVLEAAKGPVVIEINLSPGLQGITKATKIDVADHIAKFLHKRTMETMASKKEPGAGKIFTELGIEEARAKDIITNLDFRSDRILLPEVLTRITKFDEKTEVLIRAKKGKVEIKKMENGEEK